MQRTFQYLLELHHATARFTCFVAFSRLAFIYDNASIKTDMTIWRVFEHWNCEYIWEGAMLSERYMRKAREYTEERKHHDNELEI